MPWESAWCPCGAAVLCMCAPLTVARAATAWTTGLASVPVKSVGVSGGQVEHLLACQLNKPSLHCWGWGQVRRMACQRNRCTQPHTSHVCATQDRVTFKSSAPEPLRCVVATPCGTWAVAGGVSGKCYLWEVRSVHCRPNVSLWTARVTDACAGAHCLSLPGVLRPPVEVLDVPL